MRFFGVDLASQGRLALMIPLVALVLSLFVVYPTWQRYSEEAKSVEKLEHEKLELKATITQLSITPPSSVAAAEEDAPSEQPQFLEQIRRMSAASNCRLVGFEALPAGVINATSPIRPMRARVTLEASYQDIRQCIEKILSASRLYTITDMDVALAASATPANLGGNLRTIIEVERYITPVRKNDTIRP